MPKFDLAGLVGLAAGSTVIFGAMLLIGRVPFGTLPTDRSELRLSLRSDRGYTEVCVTRTQEELLKLPPQMRKPRQCERSVLEYGLMVTVDGLRVVDQRLRPGGAFGDRPVVVDSHVPMEPGERTVSLWFGPLVTEVAEGANIPAAYELPTTAMTFEPGRAILVELETGERGFSVFN